MTTNIYDAPTVLKTPTSRMVLFELSERLRQGQAGEVLIADADGVVCGRVCGASWADGIRVSVDGADLDQFGLQKYLQEVV
jgi:hypothetical protein